MSTVVERELRDAVAILYLNRPERRNALSGEVIDRLLAELSALDADPTVRCVVISGRGPAFCAGGDLGEGLGGDGFAAGHRQRGRYAELLGKLPALRVPVIAAVNGDALGGGLGLVAASDLVVADPGARFGTPEIRVGLFPWMILAALVRDVPRKPLFELVALGEKVTAERAMALNLVNRLSAPGAALEEALALAARVARQAPVALSMGKAAFHRATDLDYADALAFLHSQLSLNLLTEDAAEGVAAFLQKREPAWKGR